MSEAGRERVSEFKIKFVSELRDGYLDEKQEKIMMSERENVVTMVRKITEIQKQAVMETQKEVSYSQLMRVGKPIAEARSVDFYAYDMNVNLAQYGCSLLFMREKDRCLFCNEYSGITCKYAVRWSCGNYFGHTGRNERLAEIEKLLRKMGQEWL